MGDMAKYPGLETRNGNYRVRWCEYIRLSGELFMKEGFDKNPLSDGARWLVQFLRRADILLGERNLARLNKNYDPPITDRLFSLIVFSQ